MQTSNFLKIQEITETVGCLDSHTKFLYNIGLFTFGHKPRISDGSFSEAGKFERLSYPVLEKGSEVTFLCILLVQNGQFYLLWSSKARAIFYPTGQFAKKTNSLWSVCDAQHPLESRTVLPGATVSHINVLLSN